MTPFPFLNLQLTNEVNVGQASSLSRQYDDLGRSVGTTLGDNYAVSYAYDDFGRFSAVSSSVFSVSSVVDYSYLEGSSLISGYSVTDPASSFEFQVFNSFEDNRNAKTQVLNEFGTNLVSSFDYTYDPLMRRTQRIDTRGAGTPVCTTNDFGYNARSELIDADMGADAYAYAYDLIGNRSSFNREGTQSVAYVANQLNQYTNITTGGASSPSEPSYDLDGNLLFDGINTYIWNGENRLIQASNATTVVTFKYDYQGRRFEKTVNATNTDRFVYDGWNLVSEMRSQGSEVSTNSYVWGIDLSGTTQEAGGVGGLLSVIKGGANSPSEPFFSAYDANGNVTDYVSTNGTVAAHFEYDAFGNTTCESIAQGLESKDFAFRFSTKYQDAETGLLYYGFRYYNPEMGRWLNRDPIGERGGLNLYVFVKNNIVNRYDFLGLTEEGCPCTDEERAEALSAYISCMNAAATAASAALSALDSFDSFFDDATEAASDNTRDFIGDGYDTIENWTDGFVDGPIERLVDRGIDGAEGYANLGMAAGFGLVDMIREAAQRLAEQLIEENYNQSCAGCLEDWESACPSE